MDQDPSYKLTEEVARQAAEVSFKVDDRWQIAFSNPTAGPWKRIHLGGYTGGRDLKYAKEEDRPDLILFARNQGLFLILEAKDDIGKLLQVTGGSKSPQYSQLIKSAGVFGKEVQRIDTILGDAECARLVFGKDVSGYHVSPGYLFPEPPAGQLQRVDQLVRAHRALCLDPQNERLRSCVLFMVHRHGDGRLTVHCLLDWASSEVRARLTEALPTNITVTPAMGG